MSGVTIVLATLLVIGTAAEAQAPGKWVTLAPFPEPSEELYGAASITVAFGVLGYLLRKFEFEAAPLVLAMILGPQLEAALRRSLISSHGDFAVFLERPVSLTLLVLAALMLLTPLARRLLTRTFWRIVGPVTKPE